jgi:hypothetical protein
MSKFMLLQAAYCVTGILFFVRDLLARIPMGVAMLHAFIWPYAQWMLIKAYAVQYFYHLLSLVHH